jgi:SAM-dependent methyltransferase
MIKDQMEKIYGEMSLDSIPWYMESPPKALQTLVTDRILNPCKVIELGCGTGNYVLYFSRNDFDAIGVDISENAIQIARESALRDGLKCTFVVADVLGDLAEIDDKFDFAYDWELLHHIFPEDREKYIENVWRLLNPRGYYLSVCFSEDNDQFGGAGKYRETPLGTILYFSSETEIKSILINRFTIEELKTIEILGKRAIHKVIYALSKKKNG